jgi:phenylacetate-coenzyme A ligase PaaK-like adenylate-forming protein
MATTFGVLIRKIRELRANARLAPEQFAAMKLARFRHLVRYVNEHSPWYRDVITERGIDVDTCVPGQFPPLTKAVLMANFDRIVTDRRVTKAAIADFLSRSRDPEDQFLNRFRIIHTSGSSGEVGYSSLTRGLRNDWSILRRVFVRIDSLCVYARARRNAQLPLQGLSAFQRCSFRFRSYCSGMGHTDHRYAEDLLGACG